MWSKLYVRFAQGVPDEELLDDVSQRPFFRCRDMLEICEAQRGRVACRNCGSLIRRRQGRRIQRYGIGLELEGGEDALIHEFHVHDGGLGIPLGVKFIEGGYDQVYHLLDQLACGPASTPGLRQTRRRWHINARHLEHSKTELQAIARELGIMGCGRMRKEQMIEVIERVDPARFKAWTWEHDSND